MKITKKSIKWKLTITFIIVIVCCIGSILIFNSLFLEKLYILEKKEIIKKSYYALEEGISYAYSNGYTLSDLFSKKNGGTNGEDGTSESNLSKFLRELQENYNVSAVFMDKDNQTYSIFSNNMRFDKRMMTYIFKGGDYDSNLEILEKADNYTIGINTPNIKMGPPPAPNTSDSGPNEYIENKGPSSGDTQNGSNFGNNGIMNATKIFNHVNKDSDIECFGFLSDNETAFFLTIPAGSIKEPIALFNKVLVILSVFILVLGSFAIVVISNNFTKPLSKLTIIANKVSNLEFQNKYEDKREDEIGELGNSINEMSEKLEATIGELKNANIKLKSDLEKKEQLDLMRQDFVANVSHELKTPIALIEGYAEGLETKGIADDESNRNYYISVIKDEADRMNNIVHELLDLAAIERGASDIDIERINLKDVVNGILTNFDIKLKEKDLKVEVNIKDDLFVWVDEFKFEKVVRNYLQNAINHVDDNKKIVICTDESVNDKVRLSVVNSCKHLPEEELTKIWEKFYKVDKAHTRSYGGTGLGLSIVKAIAEQHNTVCGCENVDLNGIEGIKFFFDLSFK